MAGSQLRFSSSLHETVREEILNRINNGAYQPEALIPSTAMLGQEFGVSPITIKRALRDLQAAGVLVSIAGKGTYVKKQTRILRRLDVAMPSVEGMTIQLISITRDKISDPTMRTFDPPKGSMLCVRKVIFADGAPFMYDASYLSSDVEDEIVDEFGEQFVTNALKRHGISVVNTDLIIDAAPAVGEVEEVFGIPTGYPMLRRFYKFTTTDPSVTVFGVVQAPFDQLACTLSIPADRKSGHFGEIET
ncbi:MAG: GntR family transcriptional regulator [Mesorhizobium sp.]|uniref:GntR family transcriptional regulator n=1 Tax=unclassified Mesorhizobium TaxID=325217 RepID=UPI000FCCB9F6|nr:MULTISPECIES: GntR family transcriptional regulator [unclassified Mesorhizobium]MCT2581092.1 GntR family transcriptional regulator [Mesorhizobium sp. P13.3]MDF3170148.1 GntR family transcriptional regulator [Mesorhizobium sp. P16.1]MDF3181094.1 GntR family transcriptional regulator [Mesorhizobium sp. P17.1]MDF3187005.1 GntR family transcriptional regulator [Mesorhizobium sp. ICCV3110.1]RUV55515.1 GntR family transcriptional regulator [Mesorhizobium sp. M1A.F.Ca.IN.022.02.1.1]